MTADLAESSYFRSEKSTIPQRGYDSGTSGFWLRGSGSGAPGFWLRAPGLWLRGSGLAWGSRVLSGRPRDVTLGGQMGGAAGEPEPAHFGATAHLPRKEPG